MTTYIAENIETGEVIEGGSRDIARKLGVVPNTICNAVSTKSKVRFVWIVKSRNLPKIPKELWEEWDRVTAPFKKLKNKGVKI